MGYLHGRPHNFVRPSTVIPSTGLKTKVSVEGEFQESNILRAKGQEEAVKEYTIRFCNSFYTLPLDIRAVEGGTL